jgi:tRNA G46 methylase TrmB
LHDVKTTQVSKNTNNSGLIESSQAGVHPCLEKLLRRHLQTPWAQPLHRPTLDAYRQLKYAGVLPSYPPLILDSGCGTGMSTRGLANLYPGHLVIGVDRSQARLARGQNCSPVDKSGHCTMVRAELATFWRLLANDGCNPEKHFILYPNPWPKPGHLSRRWHGHPVFPQLLSLGGEIELRCNWEIYALEFALAVGIATGETCEVARILPDHGVSPFEKKYLERGHPLFSVYVPAKTTAGFRAAWHAGRFKQ